MDKDVVWAKLDGRYLAPATIHVAPAQWHGARLLAKRARDGGLPDPAEALERHAEDLEALVAMHGVEHISAPLMGWGGKGERSRVAMNEPFARELLETAIKLDEAEEPDGYAERSEKAIKAAAEKLPPAWSDPAWSVAYARRSQATIRSAGNGLPRGQARSMVEASKEAGRVAAGAAEAAAACKALGPLRRAERWGETELMALALVERGASAFGKSAKALGAKEDPAFEDEADRFAEQKAFVAYMPASRSAPEGFWGSTNRGGMDLGGAKMFENEERARSYFDRQGYQGHQDYALVEVSVRLERVAAKRGSFDDGALGSGIARMEAKRIEEALQGAQVEQLRARLAELEAGAPGAGAEREHAKKSRPRL